MLIQWDRASPDLQAALARPLAAQQFARLRLIELLTAPTPAICQRRCG